MHQLTWIACAPAGLALAAVLALAGEDKPAAPNFAENVAPLIFAKCAACHRPGEAAPFALLGYDDVKKHAQTIRQVVESRYMPPWHPDAGWSEFKDELRLSDEQVQLIGAWIDAGLPPGDPARTPPLPKFAEGWQLGPPDLVVTMDKAFDVPAGGPDIYRNFVLPLKLEQDQWVKAVEVRPSARKVVHHVLFFLDDSGEARQHEGQDGKSGFRGMGFKRSGSLGGWAVGAIPRALPEGLAMSLPKGSDLVLQTHFHPSGKAEQEKTTVGLYFAKEPPKRTLVGLQLPPLFGRLAGLDIPAGEKDFKLHDTLELPCDVDVINVGGHAHYLGKTMRATATLPDEKHTVVKLFSISDWDFNWQGRYEYAHPPRLPKGTRIDVDLAYDNSSDNPHNPHDPPQRVKWGIESENEMGSITFTLVPVDEKDTKALQRAAGGMFGLSVGGLVGGGGNTADRLAELDLNGDGKIQRSEVPELFRTLFDRLDTNGDGVLDEAEIAAARERRGRGGRDKK
jgi:mono/diheme cytochrome c family protein